MSNRYERMVNFRANKEELSILSRLDAKYNGSQSSLLRQLIKHAAGMPINNPITPLNDRKAINELEMIRSNLYRIGGNINQIAHFISINKIKLNYKEIILINHQILVIQTMTKAIRAIEKRLSANGD